MAIIRHRLEYVLNTDDLRSGRWEDIKLFREGSFSQTDIAEITYNFAHISKPSFKRC